MGKGILLKTKWGTHFSTPPIERNNMDSKRTTSSGIGFVGLLTIVFITLKLLKVITWSWWWVLSPIWIDIILTIVIVAIVAIIEAKR